MDGGAGGMKESSCDPPESARINAPEPRFGLLAYWPYVLEIFQENLFGHRMQPGFCHLLFFEEESLCSENLPLIADDSQLGHAFFLVQCDHFDKAKDWLADVLKRVDLKEIIPA
jgi:hypothetical protein